MVRWVRWLLPVLLVLVLLLVVWRRHTPRSSRIAIGTLAVVVYDAQVRPVAKQHPSNDFHFGKRRTVRRWAVSLPGLPAEGVGNVHHSSSVVRTLGVDVEIRVCLLYTSPSPRDRG